MTQYVISWFLLFSLIANPVSAEKSLQKLLERSDNVLYLDGLPKEERQNEIAIISDAVANSSAALNVNLLKLLCFVKPWTSGDLQKDNKLEEIIWNKVKAIQDSNDNAFKYIDCALANRTGGFFELVSAPLKKTKSLICSGASAEAYESSRIEKLSIALTKVRVSLENGYSGANVRSYYLLNVDVRRAMLKILEMRIALQKNDLRAAKNAVNKAIDILSENIDTELLKKTRNGWRYYNDLVFYRAFYSSLIGKKEYSEKLAELAVWPVLKNSRIWDLIDNKVQSELLNNESYIDVITIERILPSPNILPSDDCDRWRRRSYQTRKMAKLALACLGSDFVLNRNSLNTLDDCFSTLEATDWFVQFSASGNRAASVNLKLKIKQRLVEFGEPYASLADNITVKALGRVYFVTTTTPLATSYVDSVRAGIEGAFSGVLFGRAKTY